MRNSSTEISGCLFILSYQYKDKIKVALTNTYLLEAVDGSGDTEQTVSLIQSSIGVVNGLMEDSTESEVKKALKINLLALCQHWAFLHSNKISQWLHGNHKIFRGPSFLTILE